MKNHNYYLKHKCHELAGKVTYFNQKLQSFQTKFGLSDTVTASLHVCISEVPLHLYEGAAKRVQGKREKEFHPAIKRFALTLHLCSAKAYRLILISDSIISTTDLIPYSHMFRLPALLTLAKCVRLLQGIFTPVENKCSDRSKEVKLPVLVGNYDRQTIDQ